MAGRRFIILVLCTMKKMKCVKNNCEMQVAGMAEKGILPKVLGTRNKYGAPTYGIVMSATGIAALATLSFSEVAFLVESFSCYYPNDFLLSLITSPGY